MKKLFILIFLIRNGLLYGQQMPITPLIPNNLFLNNPAAAGLNTDNAYRIRLLHRNQWLGVNDAPTTQIIAADKSSQDEKNGIGITAFQDKTHVLSQQGVRFAYARHLWIMQPTLISPDNKPKYESRISLGLNSGFINRRVNLSDALLKNPNDPLLMNKSLNQMDFELGGGFDFTYRINKSYIQEWHLGGSFNHYTPFSSQEVPLLAVQTIPHYNGYVTYSRESTSWKVEGQAFFRTSSPQSSRQFELATFAHLKKVAFVGVAWKTSSNAQSQYLRYMAGIADIPWLKNLQILYGFEHGVPTTKSFTSAFSHDIGLSFTL
jgi:type IX secretion system PorP/SprF family membrane protein